MTQWAQPGADALLAGAAFPTTFFVQRHLADPGVDGTANLAADTRRIEVDFGPIDPVVDGAVANTTYGEILNATHDEDVTHVSYWDTSVGGLCYFIDDLAAPLEILIGETVAIAIGQAVITLPLWT